MIDFSRFYTYSDHFTIVPAITLVLFGCAILLFDFLLPQARQRKLLIGQVDRARLPAAP